METLILRTSGRRATGDAVEPFARTLREGGLVAFPTETVYGIAADRDHADAVRRLRALKERPAEKPLTIHLASAADLAPLAAPLPQASRRLVRRLWPGPLTLVTRDRDGGFTGFRTPDNAWARRLLAAAGRVVIATSANASGDVPLLTGAAVVAAFRGRVEAIIEGGPTREGGPSTVVRVDGTELSILRRGVLDERTIRQAAGHIVLFVCTGNLCRSPMAEGILRAKMANRLGVPEAELERRGLTILSAGTAGITNEPATPAARLAAARHGADLSRHSSRDLTPTLASWADEIYVAERRHAALIEDFAPEARSRIRYMLPGRKGLPDPFGRSDAVYRKTADRLARALDRVAERLGSDPIFGQRPPPSP